MSKKGGLLTKSEKKLFLNESLDYMKNTQEKMMNENGFGKETNRYIFFPERNRFYMYDEKTKNVFFEARFQVIGTYAKKSETWRWGWSNRYVPNELEKTALKIMEFGKMNEIEILSKSTFWVLDKVSNISKGPSKPSTLTTKFSGEFSEI